LALSGLNAPIERVFSIINALWADEIKRLKTETVKALTIVTTHFKDFSCSEVFLEQVHKSDKYSGESGKAFTE
jgi:hypothetical protein